ncbi:MAG: protein jag [Fusobacteriota bacterium]
MKSKLKIKAKNKKEAQNIINSEYDLEEYESFEIIDEDKVNPLLGLIGKKNTYTLKKNENLEIKVKCKIEKLLELMELDFKSKVKNNGEKIKVQLDGKDNGILIGKKGKTLNSFEYLINSIINNKRIEVNVDEFKEKRNKTVISLAKKMAQKVLRKQKAVKLNPMPPRERKLIHEVINEYEGLETHSEGRDPKRYIVIKLVKEDN